LKYNEAGNINYSNGSLGTQTNFKNGRSQFIGKVLIIQRCKKKSKMTKRLFVLLLLFLPVSLFSQNIDIRILRSLNSSQTLPSGHTSSAFTTAISLSLAYPKWYIIVPTYTWAGTVAFSRMDLGVHYPSDGLIGALVGAGTAWLCYEVNKKLNKNSRKKPCNCPEL